MKKNWKALLAGALFLAMGIYWAYGPSPGEGINLAQSGGLRPSVLQGTIVDAPKGYFHAMVESSYVNSSYPNGGYSAVNPTTGDWFDLIQIRNAAAGAAQAATIRFWASATDSTSILDKAMVIKLTSGGDVVQSYPVHCKKVTLTGIDATDDFYVLGYVRDH